MLTFPDSAAWEAWLAAHHASENEAWLRIAKKDSGLESITIREALDVALCYGWIDGQRKGNDEASFLQRYCPRRARSSWSKINVGKVEALIAAGRMQPPGLAQVAAARADGRWAVAYEGQGTAQVPVDLTEALAGTPAAAAAFEAMGRSDRYTAILPLLKMTSDAGRPEAIARLVERLAAQNDRSVR